MLFQELIEKLKKSSYILQKWNEKKLEDIQQKKKEQSELLHKKQEVCLLSSIVLLLTLMEHNTDFIAM